MQLPFHPNNFHPNNLQFSRTRRESKSRYWARNAALFDDLFTNHFCRGWAGIRNTLLFPLSAWFWAGVCSAGRVGGQVTQSGSTRIPSPAVAVVAAVGCTYRADATHLPGRRCWKRRPRHIGQDRQIARNPRRHAVPLWGGDIL